MNDYEIYRDHIRWLYQRYIVSHPEAKMERVLMPSYTSVCKAIRAIRADIVRRTNEEKKDR